MIVLLVLTAAKAANIEEIFKPIVSWLLSAIKVHLSPSSFPSSPLFFFLLIDEN